MARIISRPVILLGLVSLFTDMASEMLYPVLPMYLTGVLGASMLQLGILEGVAEAIASLLKAFFGALSDRLGRRSPFVIAGYTLSALSKPVPGVLPFFRAVAAARIVDRLGKAVRTASRDALLAGYAPADAQGAVFGFHRAMDTLGAAIGPSLALLYLVCRPGDYRTLFLIAFIPSVIASLLTLLVRDIPLKAAPSRAARPCRELLSASPELRLVLLAAFVFALANSSDVFLIMRAKDSGFGERGAIAAYVLYNLGYAACAYPLGRLSDRFGKKHTFQAGLLLYCLAYLCFAAASSGAMLIAGFALYALYAAASESIIKAWVSEHAPAALKGSAFGLLTTLMSMGAVIASAAGGYLWDAFGPQATFLFAVAGAIAALLLTLRIQRPALIA